MKRNLVELVLAIALSISCVIIIYAWYRYRRSNQERAVIDSIFNLAENLIVVFDRYGRVMRLNQAYEELIGRHSHSVRNRAFWQLFSDTAAEAHARHLFANLHTGEFPHKYEGTVVTSDGDKRLIAWTNTAILDRRGGLKQVLAMGTDISEHRLLQSTLELNKARFRAVFEGSSTGILLTDIHGHLLLANAAAQRFFQHDAANLHAHLDELMTETALSNALANNDTTCYWREKRYLHGDNMVRWGRITASLVRNLAGDPHYIISTIEDITAWKELKETLTEVKQQLTSARQQTLEEQAIVQRLQSGLSPQEWKILTLLTHEDLTYIQIGRLLSISPDTVKAHVHHIGIKLKVKGRQAIVRAARQRRLLVEEAVEGVEEGQRNHLVSIPAETTNNKS